MVADLADERAEALADELGNKVVYVRTDVTSERDVEAAVDAAYSLGTLRHVVISHGGWGVTEKVVNRDVQPGQPRRLREDARALPDRHLQRAAPDRGTDGEEPAERGRRAGSVVATASIAGYEGQIGQSAYAAAKAGVIGLTLPAPVTSARSASGSTRSRPAPCTPR